jgi:hypothetical protein
MKTIRILLGAVLLLAAAAGTAAAQDGLKWRIAEWDGNEEKIGGRIGTVAETGLTPVGFSAGSEGFSALFVDSRFLPMKKWTLRKFENRGQLEQGIEKGLAGGFLPVGMGSHGGTFYMLLIQMNNETEGWQLLESSGEITALQEKNKPYVAQGAIPYAMSTVENGRFLTLVLQNDIKSISGWKLEEYPADGKAIKNGVRASARQGFLPWSFDRRANAVRIAYIKLTAGGGEQSEE